MPSGEFPPPLPSGFEGFGLAVSENDSTWMFQRSAFGDNIGRES